jgi:hypothetical protein
MSTGKEIKNELDDRRGSTTKAELRLTLPAERSIQGGIPENRTQELERLTNQFLYFSVLGENYLY